MVAGRKVLARSPALTLAFINVGRDPSALLEIASMIKKQPHDMPLHVGLSGHHHVHSYRKPLFLATLSTAIVLNDKVGSVYPCTE